MGCVWAESLGPIVFQTIIPSLLIFYLSGVFVCLSPGTTLLVCSSAISVGNKQWQMNRIYEFLCAAKCCVWWYQQSVSWLGGDGVERTCDYYVLFFVLFLLPFFFFGLLGWYDIIASIPHVCAAVLCCILLLLFLSWSGDLFFPSLPIFISALIILTQNYQTNRIFLFAPVRSNPNTAWSLVQSTSKL